MQYFQGHLTTYFGKKEIVLYKIMSDEIQSGINCVM